MMSVFRYDERTLLSNRASAKPVGEVAWRVRVRGDQELKVKQRPLVDSLGGSAMETQVLAGADPRVFSYIRGGFVLQPGQCRGVLTFSIDLLLHEAPGVFVTLGLFNDEGYAEEVTSRTLNVAGEAGMHTLRFTVDFDSLATVRDPLHGFVQVGLRTGPGAVVTVGEFAIRQSLPNPSYRSLRIRYDAFGDETKASSRLRVWKFAKILKDEGHTVLIGGKDHDVDLYVAQKNRSFATVKAVRAANPAAVIVYDFDDNYTLPEEGVLNELIAFINFVDVVTCGSEHLAAAVRHWHPNVYVLENPVDIGADKLVRPARGSLRRVGWFGAPEGLAEVAKAGVRRPYETVTKGGDIAFSIETVDRELTAFDLLLFPLEPTPWNLAKNANRMMKALGLGVPVLVSDTPEHARIHALTGLPDDCLVREGEDWDAKIGAVAENFKAVEAATAAAREVIWANYAPRTILTALMEHLSATTRLGGALVRRNRSASPAFADIDVLIVEGAREDHLTATLSASSLDWAAFRRVGLCSARRLANPPPHLDPLRTTLATGDFFGAYEAADAFIASSDARHVLFIPAGLALGHGAVETLEALVANKAVLVGLLSYSDSFSAVMRGLSTAYPLRELLMAPAQTGPLLIQGPWLREQGLKWANSFDLWSWTVAVRAIAAEGGFAVERLPLAFEAVARARTTPSRNFAHWLELNEPAVARELPDVESQWRRLVVDIVTAAAAEVRDELPATVGQMQSEILALRRQLDKAASELKSLKAKK